MVPHTFNKLKWKQMVCLMFKVQYLDDIRQNYYFKQLWTSSKHQKV